MDMDELSRLTKLKFLRLDEAVGVASFAFLSSLTGLQNLSLKRSESSTGELMGLSGPLPTFH